MGDRVTLTLALVERLERGMASTKYPPGVLDRVNIGGTVYDIRADELDAQMWDAEGNLCDFKTTAYVAVFRDQFPRVYLPKMIQVYRWDPDQVNYVWQAEFPTVDAARMWVRLQD